MPKSAIPNDPSPKRQIVGFRSSESLAKTLGWYHHPRGQLVWSPDRVQLVHTANGVWVTPPAGAIWIPPDAPHRTNTPHEHNLSLSATYALQCRTSHALCELTPLPLRALEPWRIEPLVQALRFDPGYQSQHKFISTFRRVVGTTPGRYVKPCGAA